MICPARRHAGMQLCSAIGAKQCIFGLTEGLNEAGLGVTANWDSTVTGYLNYSGTKDSNPRTAISFTVCYRVDY